jgi:hypothetical protein
MKKLLALFIALTALLAVPAMAEMTAEEIIAKHIEASGGEAAMRAVKSMYMKGSMFMQGMPMDLQVYTVLPDKSYYAVSSNGAVLGAAGTNATDAWSTQMGQTFTLAGKQKDEVKKQADQFTFLDYKKKGSSVKYLGEDMVKGAKAYKVEVVSASHDTSTYFFDATSYYLVREKSGMGTSNMSNHKKIGDLVFPTKMMTQIEAGGQSMQQMITIDSIAVNVPIADSLFVMPKDAKPMPQMPTAPADSTKAPAAGGGK